MRTQETSQAEHAARNRSVNWSRRLNQRAQNPGTAHASSSSCVVSAESTGDAGCSTSGEIECLQDGAVLLASGVRVGLLAGSRTLQHGCGDAAPYVAVVTSHASSSSSSRRRLPIAPRPPCRVYFALAAGN